MNCLWRDVSTGERVCLVPDCPTHSPRRVANRCTRTDPHSCQLGRHQPRRAMVGPQKVGKGAIASGLRMLVGGLILAVTGYGAMLVIALASRA